jgi:hypothetical protein
MHFKILLRSCKKSEKLSAILVTSFKNFQVKGREWVAEQLQASVSKTQISLK